MPSLLLAAILLNRHTFARTADQSIGLIFSSLVQSKLLISHLVFEPDMWCGWGGEPLQIYHLIHGYWLPTVLHAALLTVDRYQTFGTYLRIICIATSYQCTDSMNVMGRSYKLLQATLSMERTKSQESAVAAEAENAVHRRRWKELVQWGKAFIFVSKHDICVRKVTSKEIKTFMLCGIETRPTDKHETQEVQAGG